MGVQIYGTFTKVDVQADGTIFVEGVASSEARDSQKEVVKAGAMKAALPGYLAFPALREMHQPWAAGRTMGATVSSDGKTYIRVKVVDREACAKVREGVYNGFSIGGSVKRRNTADPSIIEELELTEISLVDRPSNPEATIAMWKADVAKESTMADDKKPFPPSGEPDGDEGKPGPADGGDEAAKAAACPDCGTALTCPKCSAGTAKAAQLTLEGEALRKERDGLAARLTEAEARLTKVQGDAAAAESRLTKVAAERESSGSELSKVRTARDEAEHALSSALLDRDSVAQRLQKVQQERDAIESDLAKLRSERDRAETVSEQATAEKGVVEQRLQKVLAERDASNLDSARLRTERDQAEDKFEKANAERDSLEQRAAKLAAEAKIREEQMAKHAGRADVAETLAARQKAEIDGLAVRLTKVQGERDEHAGDLAKAKASLEATEARLAKVSAEAASVATRLAKVQAERDSLQAELARRPKGSLKAVPIGKADDTGSAGDPAAPPPEPEDSLSAIRKAHQAPMSIDLSKQSKRNP